MPFTDPLQLARKLHCSMLESSGIEGVDGSCLYAAILLKMLVDLYNGQPCAIIRGGDGKGDGAFIDAEGILHGHYWVEAATADGTRYVLDVTADQFGGPELVQLKVASAAGQYQPGHQGLIDLHVKHIVDARDLLEISTAVEQHFGRQATTQEA